MVLLSEPCEAQGILQDKELFTHSSKELRISTARHDEYEAQMTGFRGL